MAKAHDPPDPELTRVAEEARKQIPNFEIRLVSGCGEKFEREGETKLFGSIAQAIPAIDGKIASMDTLLELAAETRGRCGHDDEEWVEAIIQGSAQEALLAHLHINRVNFANNINAVRDCIKIDRRKP